MELYRVEKKSNNFFRYFFVIVVTVGVTLIVERAITKANEMDHYASKLSYQEEKTKEQNQINSTLDLDKALDCTVGISLVKPTGANILDIDIEEKWGLGTGVIVSKEGYILTNQHLAKRVNSYVIVTLNSGKSVKGKIVWNEEYLDLALIKIDEKNLSVASIGKGNSISLGEEVYAIGNPLGSEFRGSITKGIVSGLNRTILFQENGEDIFMEGLIQTDASINPGNSGGPLLNAHGQVIGINTVKITSAEGIGFAVPIDVVENVILSFEQNGTFEEASLGIYAYDNSVIPYLDEGKEYFDGIYVSSIEIGGACDRTLLQKGDVITWIDDVKIEKMAELREYLYSKKPGDKVNIMVENGNKREIEVILQKKK